MDSFEEEDLFPLQCNSAINLFKDSVDNVRKQIGSWRDEQENKKSENQFLKDKLRKVEEQLKDVKLKFKLKIKEGDDRDQEIKKTKSLLEKANAENFRLCTDCCALETTMEKQKEKIANLEKQTDADDFFMKEMKKEAENSSAEKIELIKMCRALEEKIKHKSEKITNLIIERENEQNSAKSKISELTNKLNEATNSSLNLSQQLREQRRCCESLQEKLQQTENENATSLLRIEKFSNENKKQAKLMKEKATTLGEKVDNLSKSLAKENSIRTSAENMISVLELQLKECCQNKEELEHEKENYRKFYENVNSKNKELTVCMDMKREQFEAAEIQYKNIIEKIQENLLEARTELKEKLKEVSELHKDQLSKEYEIREVHRSKNETEVSLKLKQEAEAALYKRNERLENELRQMRTSQNQSVQDKHYNEQSNADERFVIDHVLTRLDQSKARYFNNKQQQQLIQSHALQVGQLQQQLRNKSEDYRVAKIEMQYIKEELEQVKYKKIDKPRGKFLIDDGSYFDL